MGETPFRNMLWLGALALGLATTSVAEAQTRASSAIIDEVTVTARKRASVEQAQEIPVAVTALGEDQLRALSFNEFSDISFAIPNTSLDEIGTSRGSASFAIRGLSATSSIVTIDPAVATFVDGIYLPANAGTVLDTFDLEAIEILRGPQGTLFGRNVTGGAVAVRTKRPSQETEQEGFYRYEAGGNNPTHVLGAAMQTSFSDTLSFRLAAYHNDDQGWFTNEAVKLDPSINGGDDAAGANQTTFIRPSLLWEPSDDLSLWLKLERLEQKGQQPPPQNNGNFFGKTDDRVSYDFLTPGFIDVDSATLELNWDVGRGRLTNLFGIRELNSSAGNDIDATRFQRFDSRGALEIESWQNELRYAGSINQLDFTVGTFLYRSDIKNYEARNLFFGNYTTTTHPRDGLMLWREGGGDQRTEAWAVFTENQFNLDNDIAILFGLRYSDEKKDVIFTEVAAGDLCGGRAANNNPTRVPNCRPTSTDSDSWDNIGGKLGVQYTPVDGRLYYAQFTRGYRSGGFNVRDTKVDGENAPSYDEEQLDSLEFGMKADWMNGNLRTNVALFINQAEGLQRDVNVPDPNGAGVIQSTANTADADLNGYEVEVYYQPMTDLLLSASLGYVDAEYTDVFFDLNGDGVVDGKDESQTLPRVPEYTYSLGLTYDYDVPMGLLTTRFTYDHRDEAFFTDANTTPLNEADIYSVRVSLQIMDGQVEISAFGKNLDNNIVQGGSSDISTNHPDASFPTTALGRQLADGGSSGGTFSPLAKGETYGIEARFRF